MLLVLRVFPSTVFSVNGLLNNIKIETTYHMQSINFTRIIGSISLTHLLYHEFVVDREEKNHVKNHIEQLKSVESTK